MDQPRILVVGAGVNGCVCAAALHAAGINVTVLARGARLDALRADGIVIEDPLTGLRTVTRVPTIAVLQPDDVYDFILVVVRKNQAPDVLPMLRANRSPNVVFMVNNPTGPRAWIEALGRERVMQGFVFAAGKREGQLIRAMRPRRGTVPFGELDGSTTPRLQRLVEMFNRAGLHARIEPEMTDWLATHAVMVTPIGLMTLRYGLDLRALAHSSEDLRLLVDAIRDGQRLLRAMGHRVLPRRQVAVARIPRVVLVALMRWLLPTRYAEIGLAWHCSQAPDEIRTFAREVADLLRSSGLHLPALENVIGETRTAMPAGGASVAASHV